MRSNSAVQVIRLLGILSVCVVASYGSSCKILEKGSVFDFTLLQSSGYNSYTNSLGTISWNVCSSLPSSQQCGSSATFASIQQNGNNNCQALTSSEGWTSATINPNNSNDLSNGVAIQFQGESNYSFTLEISCDESVTYGFNNNGLQASGNSYTLSITSAAGCPTVDLSGLWNFMNQNKWISMIVLLALGTFLCFFGLRFIKYTLALAGFTLGMVASFIIFDALMDPDTSTSQNWTVLLVSIGVGIIGSVIAFRVEKAGFFSLGALAGTTLALLLQNIIHSEKKYFIWIELSVCSFITGTLCVFFKDFLMILASSLTGAYMIVRAISLYPGGFPNELTVSQQIENGNFTFPWYYYLYLGGIVILKISGAVTQWKAKNKNKEGDSYKLAV